MTCEHSQLVDRFFAENARNVTPARLRRQVQVLYVPRSSDREVTKRCACVLSTCELQQAERLLTHEAREQFIQRRAFRRFCGARSFGPEMASDQIKFVHTDKGRPYIRELPEIRFSFSSCQQGFLGAWSSTHRIGVDIETADHGLETTQIARGMYSSREARLVEQSGGSDRLRIFLQFWTLKEAALKSIGEGMAFGMDAFQFEPAAVPLVVATPPEHGTPADFCACYIKGTPGLASMVMRTPGTGEVVMRTARQ